MAVNQIYAIVNGAVQQAMGSTALSAVDNTSLIALGNTVLNGQPETFLNVLVQRIGRTIISTRNYESKFKSLVLTDFEWGNILQKIKISMPVSEADQSAELANGESVDMYKISKPTVTQKLFTTDTPRQIKITIQRHQLKKAFLSEGAMGSFISAIMTEVQNAIELQLETLGRNCLNNYIAEVSGTASRAINLRTAYNTEYSASLTVAQCQTSADFMAFAVGKMNEVSKGMTEMSVLYNDGTEQRHTPKSMQKCYILTPWQTRFNTKLLANAFNDGYLKLEGYEELTYLQSQQTPTSISVVKTSNNNPEAPATVVTGIIGCIFDTDALGICKQDEWMSTTPFNSAGGYANTFWHMNEMFFNDLSENFVYFYVA